MTAFAQRLPVIFIPEKLISDVVPVRDNVIDLGGTDGFVFGFTTNAQRIAFQIRRRCLLPFVRVGATSAPVNQRLFTITAVRPSVFLRHISSPLKPDDVAFASGESLPPQRRAVLLLYI